MRGDVARMSYPQALEWVRKAKANVEAQGIKFTAQTLQIGLRCCEAPFTTHTPILTAFGKQWGDVCRDLRADTVEERVALGPGVTANAVEPHNWEDSWAKLANAYSDRKRAQASEVDRCVTIDTDRPVVVLVLGDMHIGSASTDYPRLTWILSQIQRTDLNVFAVFVGDVVDAMIWNTVKFEGRASPLSVHKEVLTAVGWMKAASANGHMIGGVCGNHDLISEKLAGLSHFALAMEHLKIPLAKNELLLEVRVGKESYRWEIRHAFPGNSIYNNAHGAQRWNMTNPRDTEIVCGGHVHKSGLAEMRLHGKMRYGIQVGAYKDSDLDDYAVEKGFRRGENLADYGVILRPDRHSIEVLKTEQAIALVEAQSVQKSDTFKKREPPCDMNKRKGKPCTEDSRSRDSASSTTAKRNRGSTLTTKKRAR